MSTSGGQAAHPALLQPPFYQVKGVNPASPIATQIEQIDQLNTLLLQEIDANFARFHQEITSKILPEIKRFALNSKSTREGADFWRKFFERSAGVNFPREEGDECSISHLHSEQPSELYDDQTVKIAHDESTVLEDRSQASFMFDPAMGVSSTPLPSRSHRAADDSNESWDESAESPFERVDRQIGGLRIDESSDMPTPSLPSGYSMPALDSQSYDASTGSVDRSHIEPHPAETETTRTEKAEARLPDGGATPRAKGKGKNAFSRPSYLSPARATPLIDLSATPLNAKFNAFQPANRTAGNASQAASKPQRSVFSFDDDDDDHLEYAMSPPVTMKFSLPPVVEAYAQSPAQKRASLPPTPRAAGDEATKQVADLLNDITAGYADYEPSPRMPTPDGLRRYSFLPSDLGPGRRLFDASPGGPSSARGSDPSGARPRRSIANTSYGSDIQTADDEPGKLIGDDDDSDDDADDTFSSHGDTMHAAGDSAALAAQQGFEFVDDSYMSDGDMSFGAERGYKGPGAPQGSGARGEASEVFGRPGQQPRQQPFELMQQDEMLTYHGGKLEDARLPGSPTRPGR